MKKKISSVIAAIMVALCIVLCFSACDFISYHASDSRENISYQATLEEKKAEYVTQLRLLASEDDFYDAELQLYRLQLIESVNKINECKEIEDLPALYHSCEEAILSIKTIADYKAEEAQMKAELENAKLDWISKLKALSTADNYREAEKISYEFYLDNGINAINACEDIEGLEDIFNAYSEVILSIKTAAQYESEELAAFVLYCNGKVKEIKDYVVLEDYRLEERDEVSALIDEYEAKISGVTDNDYTAVDNLVRDFKIKVYAIPTDSELYADELQQLKGQLINELQDMYKLSNYRDAEGAQVRDLLKLFEDTIDTLAKKEDVLSQYILIKSKLEAVKTSTILANEERTSLIEELYERMKKDIANNIAESEQAEYYRRAEEVYVAMQDRVSTAGIREEYKKFTASALAPVINELESYKLDVIYREQEEREFLQIKEEYFVKLEECMTIEEGKALLDEAKALIDDLKSNDDWWDESLAEFRLNLKEFYGEDVLQEPDTMTEAKDYKELAQIIDYYAFYQKSGTEFVCDTFRVKLNFPHNDATWERNEVYWYCELLKSAVDIKAYFEPNSDYLVFTLIPYNFATVSNIGETEKSERQQSLVEYNSDKSTFKDRGDDFDDFPYYKFAKKAKVWNSQQLWYALEQGYIPVCEKGSRAEDLLNRTKAILRQIIKEGMSDEEKIFNIYKWFGENVQYDNLHMKYNNSSDPDNLPSEKISAVNSHFVEGAIYDGLAVCVGYAKAYLLMLRIEGIEAKFNLARMPYMEGKNSINAIASAFHGYVLIKLNEVWYYSDAQKSLIEGRNLLSFSFICLPGASAGMYEVVNRNLPMGTDCDIYLHLIYKGNKIVVFNKEDLYTILNAYLNDDADRLTISIISNNSDYNNRRSELLTFISINGNDKMSFFQLSAAEKVEWIIYKTLPD